MKVPTFIAGIWQALLKLMDSGPGVNDDVRTSAPIDTYTGGMAAIPVGSSTTNGHRPPNPPKMKMTRHSFLPRTETLVETGYECLVVCIPPWRAKTSFVWEAESCDMKYVTIRPPRLRTLEDTKARHATWTELFYDLVFVVAVAALGGRLLANTSWAGFGVFIGFFAPIWWAWASYTFYADRFDTDDFGQRVLAVAQMITIALMAGSISGNTADSSVAFAASYVVTRLILVIMYARARKHVPITRQLLTGYLKGFSAEVVIWTISIFTPTPARYWLWAVGLIVSVATPFAMRKIQSKVPLDVEHLPERFGLFTILVLGESMAATVVAISESAWSFELVVNSALAVSIAAGLWWMYFDNMEGSVVRRTGERPKAWKPTAWIYAHMPLGASLVIVAVGLEQAVSKHLDHGEFWLTSGGMAGALGFMALINLANEKDGKRGVNTLRAIRRLLGAGLVLAAGLIAQLVGPPHATVWLIFLLAVAVLEVASDLIIVAQAD